MKSQGAKHDEDKVRFELLPGDALYGTAQVLTVGARKYSERNWESGIKYSRVFGALQRHLWAWFQGEDNDPETGLSHIHHAGCNITFLQAYVERNMKEFDDRPRQHDTNKLTEKYGESSVLTFIKKYTVKPLFNQEEL